MTADVDNVNAYLEVSRSETEQTCGFNTSDREDLPTDCNPSPVNHNGGQDDPDASYVFVSGNHDQHDRADSAAGLNANSQLPHNLGSTNKDVGDDKSSPMEQDPGSPLKLQFHNGNEPNSILRPEINGQEDLVEDARAVTHRFHVILSEAIEPQPELVQADGSCVKAEEGDNVESVVTQESQVKSSMDASESESNESGSVNVMIIVESEPNHYDNAGATGSANLSESDHSGNAELMGSASLSESEPHPSGNVEVMGCASVSESEPDHYGNVGDKIEGESKLNSATDIKENQDFPVVITVGAQNDNVLDLDLGNEPVALTNNLPVSIFEVTKPEQNQLGNLEDQVEGESKLNIATDKKENQEFPIFFTEGSQNDNDLVLDQENESVALTNNIPVGGPQTACILEQNTETAACLLVTDLKLEAEAVDASSCGEYTNGLSAGHSQGCSENVVVNGLVDASQNVYDQNGSSKEVETSVSSDAGQNLYDQNGSSKEVETSVSSDAKIGSSEVLTVSDAQTSKGFPAAIDNGAIRDLIAPAIQLNSEVVNDHITNEKGEKLPTDHAAEESDSQTVVDAVTQASETAGNRLSEIVKFDDNGTIESYESIPVAPANITALDPMTEIEDSCPVDMRGESMVENSEIGSSESFSSHPVSDIEILIEPECDPLTNDMMLSSTDDAKPEIETLASEGTSDEVSLKSQAPGGSAKCVSSKPVSAEHPEREACIGDSVENPVDMNAVSEVDKALMVVPTDGNSHASESEVPDGSVVTSQITVNCIQDNIHVENRGNGFVSIGSDEKTPQEMLVAEGVIREEASTSSPEGSAVDASDGQNSMVEVVKRPFYYMIKIPRYDDDENLKERIKYAQNQVDEKTKSRDAIRAEMKRLRVNCNEYSASVNAAISEETAARNSLKSKRKEIDSVHAMVSRGDIDKMIHGMEYKIQHETLPLKEEKSYINEIKKLKIVREKLSSNLGSQADVQENIDHQVKFKERLEILKKEADLLKEEVLKAEVVTKNAEKRYQDEESKLNELVTQFRAADDIRQEAYAYLRSLRKRSNDKNKYFYKYKDDAKAALDLSSKGDKEELQHHCVNQVERLMELWNNNDEFRQEYVRCNTRSTIRRLQTLDGRSLGLDEDPPVIPNFVGERLAKNSNVPSTSYLQEEKTIAYVEIKNYKSINDKEQKDPIVKTKKPVKQAPSANGLGTLSSKFEIEEVGVEEHKVTKEEEELARKAEELRKEEEAAKLREQRRLEERAKAIEAMQRKKRKADKAQERAEARAQKEAEQREKEKEKKARKKEKRKALEVNGSNVEESAPSSETTTETRDCETMEKPVAVIKRSQKPLHFAKQTKQKSMPLPLRNRGKRRMQTWMWVLLTALIIFVLFLMGSGSFSSQKHGF